MNSILCRLCGKTEGTKKFTNIFNDDFIAKVNKLLPIVVMRHDPLPQGVCEPCVVQVNNIDEFYNKTTSTDRLLRKLSPIFPKSEIRVVEPILKIPEFMNGHFLKILKVTGESDELNKTTRKEKVCVSNGVTGSSSDDDDCEVVELVGDKYALAKRFLITEVNNKSFVCTCRTCSKTYTNQRSALSHTCESSPPSTSTPAVKQSSSARSLQCGQCDKQFVHQADLSTHQRLEYSSTSSPILVPEVQKRKHDTARSVDVRKKHRTAERIKLKCKECGIHFPDATILADHVKTHELTAANNNQRSFRMVTAQSIPNELKPEIATPKVIDVSGGGQSVFYACSSCDKFFTTRTSLDGHKASGCGRTHHTQQPASPSEDDGSDSEPEIIGEVQISVKGAC